MRGSTSAMNFTMAILALVISPMFKCFCRSTSSKVCYRLLIARPNIEGPRSFAVSSQRILPGVFFNNSERANREPNFIHYPGILQVSSRACFSRSFLLSIALPGDYPYISYLHLSSSPRLPQPREHAFIDREWLHDVMRLISVC